MNFETQGRKEVGEAVLLAALCAAATGLVNWGLEVAKQKTAARKQKSEEADK